VSALIETREMMNISHLDISGRRQELEEANVAAILAGLLDGQDTPPIAIDQEGRVLWGFHRLEAHARAGRETIRCDVMAFASPEAQEAAVISENLRRRHLDKAERDRLLARYVELIGKRAEVSVQSEPKPQAASEKGGRPKDPERENIRAAAKETGYSESTVRRAVAEQEEPEPVEPEAPAEPEPVLRSFGVPIPPGIAARAKCAQELIAKADGALRQLAGYLNNLEGLIPASVHQRLEQERSVLAFDVRGARPEWLCVFCKARPDILEKCPTCRGDGVTYAVSTKGDFSPELLGEGDAAMVASGGKWVPYSPKKAAPTKKKQVKVTITDLDGTEKEFSPENQPPPDDDGDLAF
jgi:hypothetical protein